MQPTRAAWMRARTDKVIRIGLIARHPQQRPHQLKTMQQNAMKEAIPVVILVILIHVRAKNKNKLSTYIKQANILLCRAISSSKTATNSSPSGVHPAVHPIGEVRGEGGVLKDVAVRIAPRIRSLECVQAEAGHEDIVVLRIAETISCN